MTNITLSFGLCSSSIRSTLFADSGVQKKFEIPVESHKKHKFSIALKVGQGLVVKIGPISAHSCVSYDSAAKKRGLF